MATMGSHEHDMRPAQVCSFSFDDASSLSTSTHPPHTTKGNTPHGTDVHAADAFASPVVPRRRSSFSRESPLGRMAESCVKGLQLMTFDAVPIWMKDNHFILSGYRVNWGWKHSFRSLWKLHNETFNVWTHFLGFLSVTIALFITMQNVSPHGIDHVQWELSTNTTCHTNSNPYLSEFQAVPPVTPWNPNATEAEIMGPSITDIVDEWREHIPDMAKVTRSLRDQMVSIQTAIGAEGEKFAHLQSEFQKNARRRFYQYVDALDDSFQSFKRSVTSLQEGTNHAAAVNLQAARDFLSSFRSSMSTKLDVMAFARTIVEDFKVKHDINATDDTHGFSVLPLPVSDAAAVQPYLSRWPLTVFMVSAMACLLFSAIFHLFTSVSEQASLFLQSLDFAGICLLTAGSNIPVLYYGFYCAPTIKWTYITIELILGFTGFIITSAPKFRALKYRRLRASVFIILGLSGVFPLLHLLAHHQQVLFIFWYLLAMGAFYLGGATLYTFHIPECWYPGRFDIFFSSHQLWHVCVFLAVCAHYVGVVEFYQWRMTRVCDGVSQW